MDRQAEQRRYVVQVYSGARSGNQEMIALLEQGKDPFIRACLAVYYVKIERYEISDAIVIDLATPVIADLHSMAASDEPSAMWLLGTFYDIGLVVARDAQKGFKLLQKSAELGCSMAQFHMGYIYGYGDGVPKNIPMATQWYQKAMDQGNPFAMYSYGHLMYEEKQFAEALPAFERAVAAGDVLSTVLLFNIYNMGQGIPKNPTVALDWLLRGANGGYGFAQNSYGRRLFFGTGMTMDERMGHHWMLKAAENGYVPAMNLVGKAYIHGWGVEQNLEEGLKWLSIGVNKENIECIVTMGKFCQFGIPLRKESNGSAFFPEKIDEAVRLFRFAAEKGNVESEFCLGLCFYFGSSLFTTSIVRRGGEVELLSKGGTVEKNPEEAVRWFRLAASHNWPEAQLYLGRCYNRGHGVTKDKTEAKKWYKLATSNGDPDAAKEMKEQFGFSCCCF